MRQKLLLATLVLLLALGGCSDDKESQGTSSSTPATQGQEPKQSQESLKGKDRSQSPQGNDKQTTQAKPDPQLQSLRQNFPRPKPVPGAKEASAEAIQAGEEACQGLTPTEVEERFYSEAEPYLDPDQRALVEELPRYEEEAPDDPSFVAGQIAATIYGATLEEAQSQYGFQGCVYSLALGLAGRR